jgi:TRAP-type C4-dicarboxylate transport system substrate-binding protein
MTSAVAHADAEYTMKIATVAPDNTPWSELLKMYKTAVEKQSGGKIKVKVYLGGTLGDENETVLMAKRGQIQAIGVSTGALASQIPDLNVIEIPYLFKTAEDADYVVDNVLGPEFDTIFQEYGFVLGFWSENGFRQFGIWHWSSVLIQIPCSGHFQNWSVMDWCTAKEHPADLLQTIQN